MQDRTEGFRLSPQQRRLWLSQPDRATASAQCALRIEGPLKVDVLNQAIRATVGRHDILRATFHHNPSVRLPIQIVSNEANFYWRKLDFERANKTDLDSLLAAESSQGSGLGDWPVLQATLATTSERERVLLLSLPLLCADAISLNNLTGEVIETYSAALRGEELPGEVTQYIQFSEWRHELLENDNGAEGKSFFRRNATAVVAAPALPFEKRPAFSTISDPASFAIELGDKAGIEALARESGTSISTLLLACWQTLLWRLTGQSRIVVWVTMDGRKYEEMRGALGLYAQAAPIDCRFDDSVRFADLLRHTAQTAAEAYDWQEYFEGEMAYENGQPPGFGFEFVDWPAPRRVGDITFTMLRRDARCDGFKLKLSISSKEDSLAAEFQFDPALLDQELVARLAGQFRRLLTSVVADPLAPIGALEILTDAERRRLVIELNDTEAGYPSDRCFHQLFEEQVARAPENVAVICEDRKLTYRELNARANQLAHRLRALGVGPESLVGVYLERSAEMVVGLLGVLKAGGAYAPLDLTHPSERLAFMLADARVSALLTLRRHQAEFSGLTEKLLCLDTDWAVISRESDQNPSRLAAPANLAYVIYTSGSTGSPKGVMISHRGLVNYLSWCVESYRVEEGRGAPVISPVGFDLTVTSLFSPLLAGRSVTLLPEDLGVEGLSQALLASTDYSLVKITPSHLEALSHYLPAEHVAHRTRALVIGGESLSPESLRFWREFAPGTRLINEYGPTETVVGCCVYEVGRDDPFQGTTPIGRPIANTQLYILDSLQRLTPIGAPGELCIAGAGLARGYLNNPEVTAEKFIPNPFSDYPGARMYRSGDLARYSRDGQIEFLGRLDHQVKVRGYRIEPGEIEASLRRHPGVREAVVVARQDQRGNKRLIAYLVADPTPTAGALREYLRAKLPDYMTPDGFVMMPALPLTPNGKVDRQALPEESHTRAGLETAYIAPQTLEEELLAVIWSQALGLNEVGIHDNFFDLGGDSIRSVQLVGLAKERGINFTVQQLFQHQTIHKLAGQVSLIDQSYIQAVRTEPFSLISEEDLRRVPAHVEDAYPLTKLQLGMIYHMELHPDSPTYHNVSSWHVRVHFDEELFRQAAQEVVARHPVLRTGFDLTSYGEPMQLVHKTAGLPTPVEDLRHLSPQEQEEALAAYFEKVRRQVFDFSRPPLLRYDVHRRADDAIQLTLVECHPIIDGWSTTYTLAEIFTRYFALLEGQPLPLEPLPLTFRDYVLMERQALESAECRKFWEECLADCAPSRLSRRASLTRTRNGERNRVQVITLPAEDYEGLKRLSRLAVVPLKSVLLAAHIKVMSLATGLNEVVTGLSVNGRPEEIGGEQVRGLFLNVVPFRQALRECTWTELARETFETELKLLPFRRYPLAAMQQRWGREPIFETLFNYLHFHSVDGVLRSGKLEILSGKDFSDTNMVQMAGFQVDPVSSQLILRLHADTTVLGDSQINALADCYAETLAAMARDPLRPHTELGVLDILSDLGKLILKEATMVKELDAAFSF
jgi:amino acid adenylation domain-containing protein